MASETDLPGLKTKADDLHVNKLKNVPADLSKLSNIVNIDFVKKTVYSQLVTKVNDIDTEIPITSGLVTKTQNDADKQGIKKKIANVDKIIANTCGLVKNT